MTTNTFGISEDGSFASSGDHWLSISSRLSGIIPSRSDFTAKILVPNFQQTSIFCFYLAFLKRKCSSIRHSTRQRYRRRRTFGENLSQLPNRRGFPGQGNRIQVS